MACCMGNVFVPKAYWYLFACGYLISVVMTLKYNHSQTLTQAGQQNIAIYFMTGSGNITTLYPHFLIYDFTRDMSIHYPPAKLWTTDQIAVFSVSFSNLGSRLRIANMWEGTWVGRGRWGRGWGPTTIPKYVDGSVNHLDSLLESENQAEILESGIITRISTFILRYLVFFRIL